MGEKGLPSASRDTATSIKDSWGWDREKPPEPRKVTATIARRERATKIVRKTEPSLLMSEPKAAAQKAGPLLTSQPPEFEVGDVTTLDAEEPATAELRFENNKWYLDLGLPKGETGEDGEAGTAGIDGTDGTNGTNGSNGTDGTTPTSATATCVDGAIEITFT